MTDIPKKSDTNLASNRKALKKFSEEKLVIIGSIILDTNFVLFALNNIMFVYVAVMLFAVGNELMWPSFMSILSRSAVTDLQGAVQGVENLCFHIQSEPLCLLPRKVQNY